MMKTISLVSQSSSGGGCEVRRSFNLVRPQLRLSEEKEKIFFFQSRKLSYDATTRTKFNVPPSLYHRRPLTMSRLAVSLKSCLEDLARDERH